MITRTDNYTFNQLDSWHSYANSHQLGHRDLNELFLDEVVVEEKIDGSQFSFGVFDGGLRVRSKNHELLAGAPEKLFERAVQTVRQVESLLQPGWTYRCEYLSKPKHNIIAYDRVPAGHLILFDVNTGYDEYLLPNAKAKEAARLGLETVPLLYMGKVDAVAFLADLLQRKSCLGDVNIEGFVVKNYYRRGRDKDILVGKFVAAEFKEKNQGNFEREKKAQLDIVTELVNVYKTEARWHKAVQHLRDAGQLDHSPKDIGLLIKEVTADIERDSKEEIKDRLWQALWPAISKQIRTGLPEWYKHQLLQQQKFGSIEVGKDDHL